MSVDPHVLAVILGMAAVTAATRVGGFFAVRWKPPSPEVEAFLRNVPAAVLGALLAPLALTASAVEWAAAAAALGVMATLRHDLAAILAAAALAALLRMPF